MRLLNHMSWCGRLETKTLLEYASHDYVCLNLTCVHVARRCLNDDYKMNIYYARKNIQEKYYCFSPAGSPHIWIDCSLVSKIG